MFTDLITVLLLLIAIKGIDRAFRGVLSEERNHVQAIDLVAAAVWLLGGAFVAVSTVVFFWDKAPLWFWPLVMMSVGGLVSMSVRAALGIPVPRSQQTVAE